MADWRYLNGACLAFSMLFLAGQASAVVIEPNTGAELPGTTVAADPYLDGTIIAEELTPFAMAVTQGYSDMVTGTVQQRVVREYGTGYLDFYWRILDVSGGAVGQFHVGNFNFPVFDANYLTDSDGLVGPSLAVRHNGSLSQYATFDFSEPSGAATLHWGTSSKFFFLHTTATSFDKSAFFNVSSYEGYGWTESFETFAPAIPEPETWALMLAGLGMVGAMARRSRA